MALPRAITRSKEMLVPIPTEVVRTQDNPSPAFAVVASFFRCQHITSFGYYYSSRHCLNNCIIIISCTYSLIQLQIFIIIIIHITFTATITFFACSHIFSYLFTQLGFTPDKSASLVVVGLDNAGKTTLLTKLSTGKLSTSLPPTTAGGRPLIGRGKRKILYFQVQIFTQCSDNIHIKVNQ